jgi:capsular polysaccharide biosynthesis protein
MARPYYNAAGLWLLWLRLNCLRCVAAVRHLLWPGAPKVPVGAPICRSSANWYQRQPLAGRPGAPRYLLIHPACTVPQPPARTIKLAGPDPWRMYRYRNTWCAPAFVAGLPQGRYDGLAHDVFSADGCLLADLSFFGPENAWVEAREYYRQRAARAPGPVTHLAGAAAALPALHAESNYFHWMFNVLPRFALLRQAGVTPQQIDFYVINRPLAAFHSETLARLGVPQSKLVLSEAITQLTADYLWVTSSLRASGHIVHWAAEFLRNEFLGSAEMGARGERLYISREDASQRQLVNEAEVRDWLAGLGFRSVTPGRLTVAEQAQAFARAEVVVAPHGAGLTNLVFCSPGTKVIELLTPGRRGMAYYWELSNARRLDYYYLIGEPAGTPKDAIAFTMPLDWLRRLLSLVAIR